MKILTFLHYVCTTCDTSMKTTTRICSAIAGIAAIDERNYSERSITRNT